MAIINPFYGLGARYVVNGVLKRVPYYLWRSHKVSARHIRKNAYRFAKGVGAALTGLGATMVVKKGRKRGRNTRLRRPRFGSRMKKTGRPMRSRPVRVNRKKISRKRKVPMMAGRPLKRSRVNHDPSNAYAQLRYDKTKYGRKQSVDARQRLLFRSACKSLIQRFSKTSSPAAFTQAYSLNCNNYAAGGAGDLVESYFPLFLMDLTCMNNMITAGSNTIHKPCPMYRLKRFDTTGQASQGYFFDPTAGDPNSNVAADNFYWLPERGISNDTYAEIPSDKGFIDWVDVQLLLMGATSYPSWIDVELWRFYDEDLMPSAKYEPAASADTVKPTVFDTRDNGVDPTNDLNTRAKYNAFWQDICAKMFGNRLNTKNTPLPRGVKVLSRKRYKFDPTSSTESDTRGHQVQARSFFRLNKLVDFRTSVTNILNEDDNLGNASMFNAQNQGAYSCFAKKKQRVFLVIKGYCRSSADTDTPSFDIVVRRKATVVQ